jgi:hypothetical protein
MIARNTYYEPPIYGKGETVYMNDSLKVEKINDQIRQIEEAMANPRLAEGTSSTYSRISG